MTASATFPVEVRSYEIDAYGHVNNAVVVQWLEQGRLEFLRARGMTYMSIPETMGVHVVVVSLRVDYKAELFLGDRLEVASRVVRVGRTSFTFEQTVTRSDGKLAASAEVVMVCTRGGAATPVPDELRAGISR
ncbi:MAG: putative esterase [Planctomycetes bacterium]|nr:putative esterase [Planctomycetota bacterium]